MNKYLIAVVGPTAIGKTALAIKLAQYFDTEIISADSRQFFKEMRIGTAVPSAKELAAAQHHFIQHISIEEQYSVGQFERDAIGLLDQLFVKKDIIILVGGSGLYVDAVINGLDNFPDIDPSIRQNLITRLESEGIESLQKELKQRDPEHFLRVDISNKQRVIRALEVAIGTRKPYSSFLKKHNTKRPFTVLKIGLTAPRELIYSRINTRVDLMMQAGLEAEAHKLHPKKDLNALQTVGYKELFEYFEGNTSLPIAVEEIKKNTRRFAKRQLTWYRKDEHINWFEYQTPIDEVISVIKQKTSLE